MYSIILAFRVLEAKIGHPGPIAPPAAGDGSGWRRCGTGWRRLRGCDASGRADFRRPFGNRTGTSKYQHPGRKREEGFRYAAVLPSSSPGQMASASAAKIPRSRRAGAHRAASGFDTDLPRRAGTVRGFSGGRRAYRRQKSVPGRAPRGRRRPNPDTIRTGSVTAPRFCARGTSFALLHGAGCPTLPDPANRPRRCTLLGEASRFASTVPENLRPSTRHRNLHWPTHTDINKTACQQNYTTTQLHNDTTTKQQDNKTMTSVSTEVSQY